MDDDSQETIRSTVARAVAGDEAAWRELVRRYAPLVWHTARTFLADHADAHDVSQITWLRLTEQLGRLRNPQGLASWLITTTRREAMLVLAARARENLWDPDLVATYIESGSSEPEAGTVATERDYTFWRILSLLPQRCRLLLRVFAFSPELSYQQVGWALGMPIGSIGPTRGRCLEALRRKLRTSGLFEGAVR